MNAVERREIVPFQQEIDGRGKRAVAREPGRQCGPGDCFLATVRFAEPTAFRMPAEFQPIDPPLRVVHWRVLARLFVVPGAFILRGSSTSCPAAHTVKPAGSLNWGKSAHRLDLADSKQLSGAGRGVPREEFCDSSFRADPPIAG